MTGQGSRTFQSFTLIFKSLQRSDVKMATADSKSVPQFKKEGPESSKSRKREGPEGPRSSKREGPESPGKGRVQSPGKGRSKSYSCMRFQMKVLIMVTHQRKAHKQPSLKY